MIFTLQSLLVICILVPVIGASISDGLDSLSLANTHDPTKDITKQLTAMHLTDFESIFAKGTMLWTKSMSNDMKDIVMSLDDDIGIMIKHSNDFDSAATLLHGFLEASGSTVDKIVDGIVKTALASHALNLLKTLQYFYVWSTLEQFHWFQALSYKSKWYDPHLWQTHPMDWNKNHEVIFIVDNPILLNDITSGIFSENPLTFDNDTLLDLVIKHDSINICKFLNLIPTTHLESLVRSGSFKILRFLAESQSIDLHLEDYHPPHTLPDDFDFFWTQGYRYLSVDYFLEKACEHGRDDILEFLYQINPNILVLNGWYITLAMKNKHLNILEWSLNHNLPIDREFIVNLLISNGYFEAFERLQERLRPSPNYMQKATNTAARLGRLDVVKWIYNKCGVIPRLCELGNIYIDMFEIFEWIETVNPQIADKDLAEVANVSMLKWLSRSHPDLLTERVKQRHNVGLYDPEKMKWMISQGWEVYPDLQYAAVMGEIETLELGYKILRLKPTREHAMRIASYGRTEVLELVHSIDSSCIDATTLLVAVNHDHLEAAKYLESILNLKGTALLRCNLKEAFVSGDLELIRWVYEHYVLKPPENTLLTKAVENGHLHIVNWAIRNQFILKTDEIYLFDAASYNQCLIFQRLVDYGISIVKIEDLIKSAFESGSLGIVKYLIGKDPENAKFVKQEKPSIYSHHVWLWLQNQLVTRNQVWL